MTIRELVNEKIRGYDFSTEEEKFEWLIEKYGEYKESLDRGVLSNYAEAYWIGKFFDSEICPTCETIRGCCNG